MTTEGARPATADDLQSILDLCRKARSVLGRSRGGLAYLLREARAEDDRKALERAMRSNDAAAWVGTIDDAVVGFAVAHAETLGEAKEWGVVDALFVETEARGMGVGERLLDSALSWLVDKGCAGADAIALPGDRAAKNFWESAGFKARLITMHLER